MRVSRSSLSLIEAYTKQIAALEISLAEHFEQHPDAKVVLSLPGLGTVLGARVLGEFGDDRTRYADAKSRENYGGTSPVTKASGRSRVMLARYARNRRLAGALDRWAFCSLTHSEGARRYYDELRAPARPMAKPTASSPMAGWAFSTTASNATSSTARALPGERISELRSLTASTLGVSQIAGTGCHRANPL